MWPSKHAFNPYQGACMRLKTQEAILVRTASCVSSCGTSRPHVAAISLVVIAVHLLPEGLGVECIGSTGHAGDDRKRNQGGQDGLHGNSPLISVPAAVQV